MTSLPGEPPTPQTPGVTEGTGAVTVRYWASARAAAGVDHDLLEVEGPVTLAEIVALAVSSHPGSRLGDVLAVCSVLVGDRPAGSADPADVVVGPGDSVEFLPPFAGG